MLKYIAAPPTVQLIAEDESDTRIVSLKYGRLLKGKALRLRKLPSARPQQPKKAKAARKPAKKPRKDYEARIHRIHVGKDSSVSEITELKVGSRVVQSSSLSTGAATTSAGKHAASEAGPSSAGAAGPSSSGGGGGATNSADGGAGRDERSELWAAHRELNQHAYTRKHGSTFRVSIQEHGPDGCTLHWVFPEGSPGTNSAWIGLYDAEDFDWPQGEPRPRYTKYYTLTSSRQEGTKTINAKSWGGVPDGTYLFSIDTGSLRIGSGTSREYCVSQRVKVCTPPPRLDPSRCIPRHPACHHSQIVSERLAGVIGAAHGCTMLPKGSSLACPYAVVARSKGGGAGASSSEATANGKAARGGGGDDDDDDDKDDDDEESDDESEEGEQQPFMFAVPLIEQEEVDEGAMAKQAYAMVDRLSYLDWGLNTADAVEGKRRCARSGSHNTWEGCRAHEGERFGEYKLGRKNDGHKTAATSEAYGEATCATAGRLVRLLANLTRYVPAMAGWDGQWNLTGDASFLDIGSGYGKVRDSSSAAITAAPAPRCPASLPHVAAPLLAISVPPATPAPRVAPGGLPRQAAHGVPRLARHRVRAEARRDIAALAAGAVL